MDTRKTQLETDKLYILYVHTDKVYREPFVNPSDCIAYAMFCTRCNIEITFGIEEVSK